MIFSQLVDRWRQAGIEEGDTLLVHSNINRTLRHLLKMGLKADPHLILHSFLESVGSTGTLLLPLFNFDFTKGIPFDIRSTPSQMGTLTEAARSHPESVRTGHPVYSFAVIGRHSGLFEKVDNLSAYSEDSPFGLLRNLGGKIGVLDLPDQSSMTFYHHIEECNKVAYRYHKIFSAPYTDITGTTTERTYQIFVRRLDLSVHTHVNPTGELMWQQGLYSGDRPGNGSGFRVVSATRMYDFVSDIISAGRSEGLLYRVEQNT